MGGVSTQESKPLPKSIGILFPAPQAPVSGCGGHNSRCGYRPPNSFMLGCLLFHNLSQRLELGDCSHPLPPSWPPPTGAQLHPAPLL